jgi:hypothetical protein
VHLALAVLKSKEMEALVGSSRQVATSALGSSRHAVTSAAASSKHAMVSAGGLVVRAACLPVTVPLHVAAATTDLVIGVAGNVWHLILGGSSSSRGGESTSSETSTKGLLHTVWGAVPFAVNTAGRITQDLGSAAVQFVAPVLGMESGSRKQEGDDTADRPFVVDTAERITQDPGSAAVHLLAAALVIEDRTREQTGDDTAERPSKKSYATSSGESSAEQDSFLDRLRLDVHITDHISDAAESPQSDRSESPQSNCFSLATPSDISKYLLRVDDVKILVSPNPAVAINTSRDLRALYVDLGTEFSDESMTTDALAQLVHRGLDIAATNVSAHIAMPHKRSSVLRIDWKPEGSTSKHIRKMSHLSHPECYKKLEKSVLVWSGRYHGPKHYGCENPLFLARGVVKRSPRDFLNLMWDSDRTGEYNKYSLGRSDTLVIQDDIFSGGCYGAKVIRSETKVPFAGLSVSFSALMHATALNSESPEEGFVIVSRSLNSGMAGCHVGSAKRVEKGNKNELLLGLNIMRPVPGNPELTDLISVSQVSSTMVPQFLAFRIGMMGVDDFFNNVRKEKIEANGQGC